MEQLIRENFRLIAEGIGAAFAAYLVFKNKQNKTIASGYPSLIKSYEDAVSRISTEIMDLRELLKEKDIYLVKLEKAVSSLKLEINSKYDTIDGFRDFCEYIPTPTWVKKPNYGGYSEMFFINQAYETQWKISKTSYNGKLDDVIWPDTIAKKFAKHDKDVTMKGISIIAYEDVPKIPFEEISKTNITNKWIIWKFPIIVDSKIFGVGGMAIKVSEECI